ncbi:hypothetical protein ACFSTD_08540 [Novosphingobium colocasiae]
MAKAGVYAADAKAKATGWANDGKAMTSRTIATLAGMIDENIAMIDDKAGEKVRRLCPQRLAIDEGRGRQSG